MITHVYEIMILVKKKIKIEKNFKLILACIIILIIGLNSHVFLFFKVKIEKFLFNISIKNILSLKEVFDISTCVPYSEWYKYFLQNTWIYIDISIIFLIPFMVMVFLFLFTFFKVKNVNENYTEFLLDKARALNRSIYTRKINRNKCILFKLFIINAYFVASVLPYFVFVVFLETGEFRFLKNPIMCLFYSNNALNLFFYGVIFRKH